MQLSVNAVSRKRTRYRYRVQPAVNVRELQKSNRKRTRYRYRVRPPVNVRVTVPEAGKGTFTGNNIGHGDGNGNVYGKSATVTLTDTFTI